MTPLIILTAILSLPQFADDRGAIDEAARAENARPHAEAIAAVARSPEEAAALVAAAKHESDFADAVIRNACQDLKRQPACDLGKDGKFRAVGVWQIHPKYCPGADTVEGQARCAARYLRGGLRRCGDWTGAFAAGSGSATCERPTSKARVATMQRVLKVLRRQQ
jgi:hypothetical protein